MNTLFILKKKFQTPYYLDDTLVNLQEQTEIVVLIGMSIPRKIKNKGVSMFKKMTKDGQEYFFSKEEHIPGAIKMNGRPGGRLEIDYPNRRLRMVHPKVKEGWFFW